MQYKTVISSLVLHECGTCSLTQDEHRRMYENEVPRRIFGAIGVEVAGRWAIAACTA
jgi:hypothetical protein